MKRVILTVLVILMVLLPACSRQNDATSPTVLHSPLHDWSWLYWNLTPFEDGFTFSYEHTQADGSVLTTTYHYDGESFSVTDALGTRTYSHFVVDDVLEKTESGYRMTLYMLFSNVSSMTYGQYQQAQKDLLTNPNLIFPATELAYIHSFEMDCADSFGAAPSHITDLLSDIAKSDRAYYGKDSYFLETFTPLDITGNKATGLYSLTRCRYDGTLVCAVDVPENTQCVTELYDGGFAVLTSDNQLFCFSDNGTLRWQHKLNGGYIPYLFQLDDDLYCMGRKDMDNRCDDLYFSKFSIDGDLLAEKTAGGSDFEWIRHVTATEEGFVIYGVTQSRDGAFPFSTDGYGTVFRAQLNQDLTLTDATPLSDGDYHIEQVGFYGDSVICSNDTLLSPRQGDRLPEDVRVEGIFTEDGGYVILREYTLAENPLSHPLTSYQTCYRQLIATGYDADGNVLWQSASDPYVS